MTCNGRNLRGTKNLPGWACLCLSIGWGLLPAAALAADGGDYLGPVAVAATDDGKTLFVACADAGQVAVVDVDAKKVIRRIDVPGRPTGVVLHPGGTKVIVTCAAVKSTVMVIDCRSGEILAKIPAGHTATGATVSADGKRVYVCNRFDDDVSVIDLAAGKEIARLAAVREPVCAAVTPDGRSVLVGNHLPADRANQFYVAAAVTIIDALTHQTTQVRLPNGANSVRGICISPDGRLAFVTHILSNYELVPSQLDQGWTNTNVLSIIDVARRKRTATVRLDEPYLGAANPWGVGSTADGTRIVVAHAGTNELTAIDLPGLFHLFSEIYISPAAGGIPNERDLLEDLRRRIKLPGLGPRGVAVAGSKVFAAEYFSDTVAVVDLASEEEDRVDVIPLGPKPRPSLRRRGEMLFNDGIICFHQWQSCATCHPDGRTDGLNWDLRNDGVGNPKNTRSMLAAHRTPPAMSTGVRPSAEAAVRSGIEHILFADRPEEEALAIDEYLKSLRPVVSPRLVDGGLSPAAARGKELFHSDRIGCATCHRAPLYTDRLKHNTGTQGPYDVETRFDTPALVEVWRTAPYLHDGRYTTVKALLSEGKHGLGDGRRERLTEQQIGDLVEFVTSL